MDPALKKYFRHFDLVCEDVREELEFMDLNETILRVCDFGCGKGLITYAFAVELEGSKCIGIDKFHGESVPTFGSITQYVGNLRLGCEGPSGENIPEELCRLYHQGRLPIFQTGDLLLGDNFPNNLDLAYCNKVLVNIFLGKHGNELSEMEGVQAALSNISRSVKPGGYVCIVEFEGFPLEDYFPKADLDLVKYIPFTRNDIRSKGRTTVISKYALFLCQKI
jgi:SAM-dependent methyltransferase